MAIVKIDWNPPPRTLRNFGFIGLAAFPLVALFAYKHWLAFVALPAAATMPTVWALLGLAAYCGIAAVTIPKALKPLFIGLSVVGAPIGAAVAYLLLGAVYFLVITPISLIFKIIGRDAMNRRFEPAAETYWIKRAPTQDMKRYFRQY